MAYVIFDTETTGLYQEHGDRIIEIAGVRVRNGMITREYFDSMINPHRFMPEDSLRVHGIRLEDLQNSPPASEVIPKFLRFVGNDTLVAHNAEFDIAFLKSEMTRLFLDIKKLPIYLCTLELSKKRFPKLGEYNLDRLIEFLKIKTDRRHRALDDVKATAKLFLSVYHEEPTLF